jgi:hypothetical protein
LGAGGVLWFYDVLGPGSYAAWGLQGPGDGPGDGSGDGSGLGEIYKVAQGFSRKALAWQDDFDGWEVSEGQPQALGPDSVGLTGPPRVGGTYGILAAVGSVI